MILRHHFPNRVKARLRMHREPHRHRAEGYLHSAFPSVRVELDVVMVAHGALPGEPVDLVKAVPRQHVPSRHADDESPVVLYESPVKRGPVAAPVVDEGALASGRGHDRGDELDEVVKEPAGGAQKNHKAAASAVKKAILAALRALKKIPVDVLLEKRYEKIRAYGNFYS